MGIFWYGWLATFACQWCHQTTRTTSRYCTSKTYSKSRDILGTHRVDQIVFLEPQNACLPADFFPSMATASLPIDPKTVTTQMIRSPLRRSPTPNPRSRVEHGPIFALVRPPVRRVSVQAASVSLPGPTGAEEKEASGSPMERSGGLDEAKN